MTDPVMSSNRPITRLSDDERLLFEAVIEFARREVGPYVREMDEQARLRPELLPKLFDLGVMGIEVPESLRRRRRDVLPLGAGRRGPGTGGRVSGACWWTCRTPSSSTPSCAGAATS